MFFCSWNIQLFIIEINPSSKVVTSSQVLTHKVQNIFEYIFWNVSHFIGSLDQLIVMEKIFKKYFAWFRGLGSQYRPFLINQPRTVSQKIIMSLKFFILLKGSIQRIKHSKRHLQNDQLRKFARFCKTAKNTKI